MTPAIDRNALVFNNRGHFIGVLSKQTVKQVEGLLESALVEFDNFIPMISVKLPYIKQFGYNATIKLDDKDFAATNPGVWCHSVHDLQKR